MRRLIVLWTCLFTAFIISNASYAQNDMFENVVLGDYPTQYNILKNNSEFIEIDAIGKNSASGFYTENIKRIASSYPTFKWSWKVDNIQKTADISIKEKEDFAASIQIIFGKRGLLKRPKVLAYAWVATDDKIGTVIKSPRVPNNLRTFVIGNAHTKTQAWHDYTRNVREDYKSAYGEYPASDIQAIGLFTDNDQTNEPVTAFYKLYFNGKT